MISPNISSRTVPATVATTAASPSFSGPSSRSTTSVMSAVNATLTILLPSRMVDSRRSGFSIIAASRVAPGAPVLTRWASLTRSSARNAASEDEKNAENRMQSPMSSRLNNCPSAICFNLRRAPCQRAQLRLR